MYLFFIFTTLFSLAHMAGVFFALYFALSWYDNVVHALAGASIGLFANIWFPRKKFLSLGIVFCVGIFWELFEPLFGTFGPAGRIDTFFDLANDLLGATLVLFRDTIQDT